jgi:hypothetical protein
MGRLGLAPRLGANPHSDRAKKYCEVTMRLRTRPWRAKTMSLNWTVGVRPPWRAAYCARTTGE